MDLLGMGLAAERKEKKQIPHPPKGGEFGMTSWSDAALSDHC
jgi:hypothetical protein